MKAKSIIQKVSMSKILKTLGITTFLFFPSILLISCAAFFNKNLPEPEITSETNQLVDKPSAFLSLSTESENSEEAYLPLQKFGFTGTLRRFSDIGRCIYATEQATDKARIFSRYSLDPNYMGEMDYILRIHSDCNDDGSFFMGLLSGLTLGLIPIPFGESNWIDVSVLDNNRNVLKEYHLETKARVWFHLTLLPFYLAGYTPGNAREKAEIYLTGLLYQKIAEDQILMKNTEINRQK